MQIQGPVITTLTEYDGQVDDASFFTAVPFDSDWIRILANPNN